MVDEIKWLRSRVARALGLDPEAADEHHDYSCWRWRLVREVQRRTRDPDRCLYRWLRDGAPMGINAEIESSGGIFPTSVCEATLSPQEVLSQDPLPNHPSFTDAADPEKDPGHDTVTKHLNDGFGVLFATRADAEGFLKTKIVTAPLGCICQDKEGCVFKYRVILDLWRNRVNEASSVPERLILPTVVHHARDSCEVASFLEPGTDQELHTVVLDFADAFMNVPLHESERAFNAIELERPVRRTRPRRYGGEPLEGRVVLWGVLGFGGRPQPSNLQSCGRFRGEICSSSTASLSYGFWFPGIRPGASTAVRRRPYLYSGGP